MSPVGDSETERDHKIRPERGYNSERASERAETRIKVTTGPTVQCTLVFTRAGRQCLSSHFANSGKTFAAVAPASSSGSTGVVFHSRNSALCEMGSDFVRYFFLHSHHGSVEGRGGAQGSIWSPERGGCGVSEQCRQEGWRGVRRSVVRERSGRGADKAHP